MLGKRKVKPLINQKIIMDTGPLTTLLCSYSKSGSFDPQLAQCVCSDDNKYQFYRIHGESLVMHLGRNQIIVTPHVLTEVSNHMKKQAFQHSSILQEKNPVTKLLLACFEEHLALSAMMCNDSKTYINYGVTDCALIAAAKKFKGYLLTEDGTLEEMARKANVKVITPRGWIFGFSKLGN